MPEYLAPGVYVEEIDTGSKPIEGVSTSTAGMIGVTERGPVNVPILITGIGEYRRWFGERLDPRLYSSSPNDLHCYLPHAIEGFFTNGGKRVYTTRVLDTALATHATFMLFNRGTPPFGSTVLLRAMRENTGTAVNPPLPVVLSGTNLQQNDWIRIGDGSDAEYRQIIAPLAAEDVLIPLNFPLSRSHAATGAIDVEQFTPNVAATFALVNASQRRDQVLEISGTAANIGALAVDVLLEIGANADAAEHRFIRQIIPLSATSVRVRLDSPLMMPYAAGAAMVRQLDPPSAGPPTAQLDPSARAGESLLFVNGRGGDFDTRTDLIVIDRLNNAERQVRRIGELHQMTISPGAAEVYPAGAFVEGVHLTDGTALTLTAASVAGATTIAVSDVSILRVGQTLLVGPVAGPLETVVIQFINAIAQVVTLTAALGTAKAVGDLVIPLSLTAGSGVDTIAISDVATLIPGQTLLVGPVAGPLETVVIQSINATTRVVTLTANLAAPKNIGDIVIPVRVLTAAVTAGASFLTLNSRIGLQVGDILRIGTPPNEEYATIAGLPDRAPAGVGPDAGNVILAGPVIRSYPVANTPVVRQNPPVMAAVQPTILVLAAQAGEQMMLLSDGSGYAPPGIPFVQLTTPTGVFYHRNAALSAALTGASAPQVVTLDAPMRLPHAVGSPVVERRPLLLIQALDAGVWGNRLRLSVEDEIAGLVSRTILTFVGLPTQIRLGSLAGVEPGTILELLDPTTDVPVGGLLKVESVNLANGEMTLQGPGLDAAQQAAHAAAIGSGTNLGVRSREFSLTVRLLRQPDPLMPSRNDTVLDSEIFRYLSMDPRHSRYVQTVVGDINGPLRLSDRRPEGESWYVRVHDTAQDLPEPGRTTALESVRLGPETLVDILSDARRRSARHRMVGGGDSIATLTDTIYIGQDDPTPENRTGLHTLRNVEEISILACPGRTSTQMQNALIVQCELMRYRFAVLDAHRPPDDSLSDVQNQRQQFDTKYAALYHPWLLIPDPYLTSLSRIQEYPIPPSGHILGVYARTDIERGVHKAPANEVVRGIVGLQRILNKEQHDILNPYPVNINVIRDFRDNNRGIRVFGGRVITSDSDWKYVNVRRLLIFIENSIDRGLQWVVFEPNAEPLWARVRRSITNFLTLVWRNGALEGTKVEEAFFVKCDRTTMTQTDIDSGRLIVVIGVAPVKPAEFVIVRIGLWTARADN
ncbi:MAG: phage tail sheath C-terminal domain-containing protein [Candidatus Entotheonellia bacterium]